MIHKSVIISCFVFLVFSCNTQSTPQLTEYSVTESPEQIKICDEVARRILTTSPRYIELSKKLTESVQMNEGKYLGLEIESSPFRKSVFDDTYTEIYYFVLYEMYPERQVNIARFAFDFSKAALYEVDMATNGLNPINFNKDLLQEYPCSR